jgi:3-oxoadipate enol-lactonase
MPVARVNDIELNHKLEGNGDETIVLVNGLADDVETWVLQMGDLLGAGTRCSGSTTGRASETRRAADQYQPSSTSWIQAKRGLP